MKAFISRQLKRLAPRKFFLIGLLPGIIPGSHIILSVIGGAVGFFLDILVRETGEKKRIKAFLISPKEGILDPAAERAAAEALLYLRLQELEGYSPAYLRSRKNLALLRPFFEGMLRGVPTLERIYNTGFPEPGKEGKLIGDIEKTAALLKVLFHPGYELEFFRNFAVLVPGDGITSAAHSVIRRIASIWSLPVSKLPEKLNPWQEEEEHWLILGLPPGSPPEEIRRVYRKLSGQFHPDTACGLSPEQQKNSEEAFIKIRKAYEVLMPPNGCRES